MSTKSVILLGEYDPAFAPHVATEAALRHSARALNGHLASEWVSTADVDESLLARAAGMWVAPGSPYRSLEKTLAAIGILDVVTVNARPSLEDVFVTLTKKHAGNRESSQSGESSES